mmetsp:Transcript_17892/g.41015  ORF Transcript_17892/g.41015 Transcript_17892/m.41015 type:complete len:215 (-) Transcript_17892:196-840(-)
MIPASLCWSASRASPATRTTRRSSPMACECLPRTHSIRPPQRPRSALSRRVAPVAQRQQLTRQLTELSQQAQRTRALPQAAGSCFTRQWAAWSSPLSSGAGGPPGNVSALSSSPQTTRRLARTCDELRRLWEKPTCCACLMRSSRTCSEAICGDTPFSGCMAAFTRISMCTRSRLSPGWPRAGRRSSSPSRSHSLTGCRARSPPKSAAQASRSA